MNAKAFFSDQPIAYHPVLARLFGSVTAALFLSQIAYWSDKGSDPDGWIWKTEKQMTEETGLSRSEQQTARRVLVKDFQVLIEERRGTPARMFYWIDWVHLEALLDSTPQSSCRKPAIKLSKSRNLVAEIPPTIQRLPESTPKSTPISRDAEPAEFSAMFESLEGAMGGQLTPHECEIVKELWEEKPDFQAHHYAYVQTRDHAGGFNLKYYEKCLRGFNGTKRQIQILREATFSDTS